MKLLHLPNSNFILVLCCLGGTASAFAPAAAFYGGATTPAVRTRPSSPYGAAAAATVTAPTTITPASKTTTTALAVAVASTEAVEALLALLGTLTVAVAASSPENSADVRDFWERATRQQDGEEPASGAAVTTTINITIPASIPKGTSPEELTRMVKVVADTVEKQNRQGLMASNQNGNAAGSAAAAPPKKKRTKRWAVKLIKKIVMPWKNWATL